MSHYYPREFWNKELAKLQALVKNKMGTPIITAVQQPSLDAIELSPGAKRAYDTILLLDRPRTKEELDNMQIVMLKRR